MFKTNSAISPSRIFSDVASSYTDDFLHSRVSESLYAITTSSYNPTAYSASTGTPSQWLELTIGHQTYTANSAGNFIVGGTTLTPGTVITMNGEEISYGATGTDVGATGSSRAIKPQKTFGSHTVTADTASNLDTGDRTSTTSVIATGGGIEGATEIVLVAGDSTESINLGSIIMGGFGTSSPTVTPTGAENGTVAFTGGSRLWVPRSGFYWSGIGCCLAWMMLFWGL